MSLQDVGFWARFWLSLTGRSRLDKGSETYPFEQQGSDAGETVTVEKALRLSAAWACVRLRSQSIASLPLHLRDGENKIVVNHPLYRLLHDAPNADMCASEFWEVMIASLDLWGNAYALLTKSNGRLVAMEPLDPQKMRAKRADSGEISYLYDKSGYDGEYGEAEVLHLRGFTLDGLVGLSPIQYAAQYLGAQLSANRAANNEFKNSLKIGGFIESGERILQPEQREMLRKNLAQFALPENAGKFIVLEAGQKLSGAQSIRMNPHDAQLLESRYFGIEEICRAFGVPPQLIGHVDKASSWASSLEQTNLGFLTYSLRPVLVRIEQTISRKLFSVADRGKYRAKFSVEGLMRADSRARAAFYSQMLQNGVMSRNDVRKLEDLPPVDGADALTVQLNLTTIDKVGAGKR